MSIDSVFAGIFLILVLEIKGHNFFFSSVLFIGSERYRAASSVVVQCTHIALVTTFSGLFQLIFNLI